MGRNGVGKTTTLLKVIMGLLPASSGSVRFMGNRGSWGQPTERRARLGIGYVPQGRAGSSPTSPSRRTCRWAWRGARRAAAPSSVSRSSRSSPCSRRCSAGAAGSPSGGQQQQLAIGRALAIDAKMPKLIILDEPTEGIQPNIVHEIGDIIIQLNEAGPRRPDPSSRSSRFAALAKAAAAAAACGMMDRR